MSPERDVALSVLGEALGFDPARMPSDTPLAELGDEIDLAEAAFALEDALGIDLSDEDRESMRTIGGAVALAERKRVAVALVERERVLTSADTDALAEAAFEAEVRGG